MMGLFDIFRRNKTEEPRADTNYPRRSDDDFRNRKYGRTSKYGPVNYRSNLRDDPEIKREVAKNVYSESLIARGIVKRFTNNVINTGLSREAAPIWEMIPGAPSTNELQYQWTQIVENLFTMYAESKEADIAGEQTLSQLERMLFSTHLIEGEFFVIVRYLNSPRRLSPVSLQIIENNQVATPLDGVAKRKVENAGGRIEHGIEYDSIGKAVAIYVREDIGKESVRIPFFGTRSGRRFVIHCANRERPGQVRGVAELSALVYEISKLTDYDIAELEAVVASALFMASIESDVQAAPGKQPPLRPATSNKDNYTYGPKEGIEKVEIGDTAIILNNLQPGYTFKPHQPTRPNQNYEKFVRAFETRICGALGMPWSIFSQKFEASYSAARAEILFFWNEVQTRRDDFASGFLDPLYECVFTEWYRAGEIQARGYDSSAKIRCAWLHGSWNGIARPHVDPVKEVNAVEKRLKLGHTTGEREAKAYNGSDYRENVERLTVENPLLAEANRTLDPEQYAEPEENTENQDGGNE